MRKTALILWLVLWVLPAVIVLRLARLAWGAMAWGATRVAAAVKSWRAKHGLG